MALAWRTWIGEAAAKAAGFIALSESTMTWADAKAYCRQQGGKLPLIGGSTSLYSTPEEGTPIDGFGAMGGPWQCDLPADNWYWTGTEVNDLPGYSWIAGGGFGKVSVLGRATLGNRGGLQSISNRAACVP
jgi:hypothetical protein